MLLAFYDFPAEHWKHLRTSNPIESSFATVRHRTVRSKGCFQQDRARHDLQACRGRQKSWRRLDGHNQLPKIILGIKFADGNRSRQIASSNRCRLTPSVTKIRRSLEEARSIGLVEFVFPAGQLRSEVQSYAEMLSRKPKEALAAIRRTITFGGGIGFDDGLALELEAKVELAGTANFREGIAAFLQRGGRIGSSPRKSPERLQLALELNAIK